MAIRVSVVVAALILLAPIGRGIADDDFSYEGRRKCSNCHMAQYRSWKETAHGRAFTSLEPGVEVEAKEKAGLDPDKDYTEDKKCVGCHTTGYGYEGGYDIEDPIKYLVNIGCESCHGPGSAYRLIHRKAGARFERNNEVTPRQILVEAGEEFLYVERCNACHLNYEGSPWPGTKPPYTPFTPQVDPKYAFDFETAVREDKENHKHFKHEGTFTGPPLPPFHEELQANADSFAPE